MMLLAIQDALVEAELSIGVLELPAGPGAGQRIQVKGAYHSFPDNWAGMKLPGFCHFWLPGPISRMPNEVRQDLVTIRVEYYHAKAGSGQDVAARGASAMFDAFLDALDARLRLGIPGAHQAVIRGTGEAMPTILAQGRNRYVGWAAEIDITTQKETTYGTGGG